MNRKKQIAFSEHSKEICSSCSLRFIFLFSFLIQLSFAQNTNVQYDINDPRNPDCPCHKLQKQAEEEFEQQKNNPGNFDIVEVSNKDNRVEEEKENDEEISLQSHRSTATLSSLAFKKRNKHRKKVIWINKSQLVFSKNSKGIKRVRPDYSVCFKW